MIKELCTVYIAIVILGPVPTGSKIIKVVSLVYTGRKSCFNMQTSQPNIFNIAFFAELSVARIVALVHGELLRPVFNQLMSWSSVVSTYGPCLRSREIISLKKSLVEVICPQISGDIPILGDRAFGYF